MACDAPRNPVVAEAHEVDTFRKLDATQLAPVMRILLWNKTADCFSPDPPQKMLDST